MLVRVLAHPPRTIGPRAARRQRRQRRRRRGGEQKQARGAPDPHEQGAEPPACALAAGPTTEGGSTSGRERDCDRDGGRGAPDGMPLGRSRCVQDEGGEDLVSEGKGSEWSKEYIYATTIAACWEEGHVFCCGVQL